MDYESDKFIHAPTYTYNEVMHLLELVGVVKCVRVVVQVLVVTTCIRISINDMY